MCMRVSWAQPAVPALDCKLWRASPAPVGATRARVLRVDALEEEVVFGEAGAVPQCGTNWQIRPLRIEPDLHAGVGRGARFADKLDRGYGATRRLDCFAAGIEQRPDA